MECNATAWDGWLGALISALIGAAATVTVGWLVLRRTIRHERDEAVEQRRVDAWAEVAAAHLALARAIDQGEADVKRAADAVVVAAQKWQIYMGGDSRMFARIVVRALTNLNQTAKIEAARSDRSSARWRMLGERPRELSDALLRNGRVWATERDRRAEAQKRLHEAVGLDADLGPEDW